MKKKLISVLAALMVLSFGTTAFAATSPTTTTVVPDTVTADAAQVSTLAGASVEKSNADYKAAISNVSGATSVDVVADGVAQNAVNEINKLAQDINSLNVKGNAAELKELAKDASKTITVSLKAIANVNAADGAKVSFKVDGLSANSCVVVLHYNTDTNKWEVVDAGYADGYVSMALAHYSPIAVFELGSAATSDGAIVAAQNAEKAAATTAAATPAADATAVASPKTGAAMPVVAVIAAISAAGAVVCTKKAKLN